MIKIDYTLVVSNFKNERIILASWPKREHDLQKQGQKFSWLQPFQLWSVPEDNRTMFTKSCWEKRVNQKYAEKYHLDLVGC